MTQYDEKAIRAAQKKWRDQDLRTWASRKPEDIAERHDALLDLLCAHVPVNKE